MSRKAGLINLCLRVWPILLFFWNKVLKRAWQLVGKTANLKFYQHAWNHMCVVVCLKLATLKLSKSQGSSCQVVSKFQMQRLWFTSEALEYPKESETYAKWEDLHPERTLQVSYISPKKKSAYIHNIYIYIRIQQYVYLVPQAIALVSLHQVL